MRLILLFLGAVLFNSLAMAEPLLIRHLKEAHSDDRRTEYLVSVLSLALSKVLKESQYSLQPAEILMKSTRAIDSLTSNSIDVVWGMTSMARENKALAVRIPLLKGLLGYRIFLIREGDQPRFSQIKSIDELKKLSAGQGSLWPDTTILKHNGFSVVSGSNYSGLFSMLHRKRFDYFPRGVHEPWYEVSAYKEQKLAVEQKLLIHYKSPVFFFVGRHNKNLHGLLERGLKIAIADGSFNKLLYNHQITKQIFEQANIDKRLIFDLQNPLLSPATQQIVNDTSLWYQVGDELRQ
jgi:hypothetical protein